MKNGNAVQMAKKLIKEVSILNDRVSSLHIAMDEFTSNEKALQELPEIFLKKFEETLLDTTLFEEEEDFITSVQDEIERREDLEVVVRKANGKLVVRPACQRLRKDEKVLGEFGGEEL